MKKFTLPVLLSVLLCQCENVRNPSDYRKSLTDSGLSPSERERAHREKALSNDPNDIMSRVHPSETGAGVSLIEF